MRGSLITNQPGKPAGASAVRLKRLTARSQPIRVSIDLETTGLQPETDTIIEIAAVKFRGDDVLDTFQTFVATNRTIPYRVQRLTGITAADLQRAPHFEAIAPKLSAFLGRAPLVGHSVPFDAAFLRRRGLAQENPLIDTFELATVLLPALPSYTLERVADALGVVGDVFHRAMADAVLAKDVLLALLARIEQLELSVLEELALLSGQLSWPLLALFADARRARGAQRAPAGWASVGEQVAAKLGINPQVFSLGIARPLGTPSGAATDPPEAAPTPPAGGTLAGMPLAGPLSVHPAIDATMTRAFAAPGPLLLEIEPDASSLAATLLTAIRRAAEQRRPLVVAAANPAACRRLMQETLPGLWPNLPQPPRVAFLAEQNKYLCLHRWFGGGRLPRNGHQPADLTRGLAKLTLWLHYSESGIRDELVLMPQEQAAWELVRAGSEYCDDLAHCPYAQNDYCFISRARDAASRAEVLVMTQAALLEYLASEDAVLDQAAYLLILDAHMLEEEALRQGAYELNRLALKRVLDDLLSDHTEGAPAGLLALASRLVEQMTADAHGALPPEARLASWQEPMREARQALERFFNALALLLAEQQSQQHGGQRGGNEGAEPSLRLTPKLRSAPIWKGVEQTWSELDNALLALIGRLDRLMPLLAESGTATEGQRAHGARKALSPAMLSDASAEGTGLAATVLVELKGLAFRLRQLAEQGRLMLAQPRAGMVYWVKPPPPPLPQRAAVAVATNLPAEANTQPPPPSLHAAPVHAAPLLQHTIFRPDRSAVLVSSALTVAGEFEYTAERLGLAVESLPESDVSANLAPQRSQAGEADDSKKRAPGEEERAANERRGDAGAVGNQRPKSMRAFADWGLRPIRTATLSVAPEEQPHSLLYLPEDVAEPNTHHYQRHLDAMVVQLATALNGETVVLFPSHAALRAGYAGVKATLEERGILVLAQVMDGSVRQIWQTFRSQERVVLLGALNSWDSADLPGERPACVVVTRLPFPPLSDPPVAGRAELHHDQMHQFIIPQAALRLRQALNRLAWGGTRRNAVVLFDKRVQAKDYGAVFLNSMPRCTVRQGSVSLLPEHVAGWIRGEGDA